MKHYFEKNPLVQFYLEDFAIDDDFPTIRFYYKEIFWTITHSVKVKKWDLYEYHCEGSVRHLRRVSLKTIANYLKRIGECISKF
jgi:hypothetical protein